MNNLAKLQAAPVRSAREFELVDGVMVQFEEVSRGWLRDNLETRFPEVLAKFQDDGDILALPDDVLVPFATAVIAQAVASVDGPVTAAIQTKAEKIIDERMPKLRRVSILMEVLQESMVGGFRKGGAAPKVNRQARRAVAKPRSAKPGARGKKPQPTSV